MTETKRCPGVGFYRIRAASGDGMVWTGEVYEKGDVLFYRNAVVNQEQRLRTGDPIEGVPVEKMGLRWLWEPVEAPRWP